MLVTSAHLDELRAQHHAALREVAWENAAPSPVINARRAKITPHATLVVSSYKGRIEWDIAFTATVPILAKDAEDAMAVAPGVLLPLLRDAVALLVAKESP